MMRLATSSLFCWVCVSVSLFLACAISLPVPQPMSSTRYVLYDANPGEGWSFRRLLYHRALSCLRHISKAAPQYKWVLVVPSFRDRSTSDEHEWDEYFNLTLMQANMANNLSAITAKTYYNTFGYHIDAAEVLMSDWSKGFKSEEPLYTEIECPSTQEDRTKYIMYHYHMQEKWTVRLSGQWAKIDKLRCQMHYGVVNVANERFVNRIAALARESRSILVGNFDRLVNVYAEQDTVEFWAESALVVHTNRLRKYAIRFIRDLPARSFISLHFRRRDFASFHPEEYAEVDEVAIALNKVIQETSCHLVVICTDGEDSEVSALRAALQWHHRFNRLLRFRNAHHWKLSPSEFAVVEQIIASYGKVFIGSMHSYFSLVIQYERRARGHPRSSGIQLQRTKTVPFYY